MGVRITDPEGSHGGACSVETLLVVRLLVGGLGEELFLSGRGGATGEEWVCWC